MTDSERKELKLEIKGRKIVVNKLEIALKALNKKVDKIEKDRLKQAMNEQGISQARLSELTGMGRSRISQYVSGQYHPRPEAMKRMQTELVEKWDAWDIARRNKVRDARHSMDWHENTKTPEGCCSTLPVI